MANHATGRLPWAVDSAIMELFAAEAMKAAFGGLYELEPDEGSLAYKQKALGALGHTGDTQVWSESSQHVEMRHGPSGLDQVAQNLAFEGVCAAFGAVSASDEGIGRYLLRPPGAFRLLPMRAMCDGMGKVKSGAMAGLGKLLSASGWVDGAESGVWLLTGEALAAGRRELDPIFFSAPKIDMMGAYTPGPKRDEYLRLRELDILHWGPKLDWANAVDKAYPGGAGLDSKAAGAALLPSAAYGVPCPSAALAKASVAGLERALAVALVWTRADAARELHARLCQGSKDPEASEAKAKALCDKFLAKRSTITEGEQIPGHAGSCQALFESLAFARLSEPSDARKAPRPGL